MDTSSGWLDCEVTAGMFAGEQAISVESETGKVSMFVSSNLLQEQNGHYRVQVILLDQNDRYYLVSLPIPPLEGQRVVKVRRECVKADVR